MKGFVECEFYDFFISSLQKEKKEGREREKKKKRISEGKMMYDTKYSK